MSETIYADASKQFFVHMITRDISLADCILDLVDNSIDGARRVLNAEKKGVEDLSGFEITIGASGKQFSITDNCGGMSSELAINKAFHFGRPPGTEATENGIGLYGIGMKRALFKIGEKITVRSVTKDESFGIAIGVPEWEKLKEWTFQLDRIERNGFSPGTKIVVDSLCAPTARDIADSSFLSLLHKFLSRDYSFFLEQGLKIVLNDTPVVGHGYTLRSSDEIQPINYSFEEDGVRVDIVAGMAVVPDDNDLPSIDVSKMDYYGWFVVCNDRVVIAADKSTKTVWGNDTFQTWHPQYNGFMGIAFFSSEDPDKLPWSTTKRDVDQLNPAYRRAVAKMKTATSEYIQYSNDRKRSLDKAKEAELKAVSVNVRTLPTAVKMSVPRYTPVDDSIQVSFPAKKSDVKRAGKALGSESMPATKVGAKAFEYFLKNEVD